MVLYSGRAGSLKYNNQTVGQCTEWNIELSNDIEEVAVFGNSGWKDKMIMMTGWSGSCTVKWDESTPDVGQNEIHKSGFGLNGGTLSTTALAAKFYTGAVAGEHATYSGTVFIKSMSIKAAANGIIEADIQFEGAGSLTWTA